MGRSIMQLVTSDSRQEAENRQELDLDSKISRPALMIAILPPESFALFRVPPSPQRMPPTKVHRNL